MASSSVLLSPSNYTKQSFSRLSSPSLHSILEDTIRDPKSMEQRDRAIQMEIATRVTALLNFTIDSDVTPAPDTDDHDDAQSLEEFFATFSSAASLSLSRIDANSCSSSSSSCDSSSSSTSLLTPLTSTRLEEKKSSFSHRRLLSFIRILRRLKSGKCKSK